MEAPGGLDHGGEDEASGGGGGEGGGGNAGQKLKCPAPREHLFALSMLVSVRQPTYSLFTTLAVNF